MLYVRDVFLPRCAPRHDWARVVILDAVAITLAVINSLFTVLLTVRVSVAAQKKNPCDHAETITALHSHCRQLDADLDDVFDRLKQLAGRKGMRAKREQESNGAMRHGESPAEWKARMRREHPNGVPAASED